MTDAGTPDLCHIFPFAAKNSLSTTRSLLNSLASLYDAPRMARYKELLATSGLEIIDSAANMISLNTELHRWWGKALIGFEPMEKLSNGIRPRFWWLPATGKKLHERRMDLSTDPRPLL